MEFPTYLQVIGKLHAKFQPNLSGQSGERRDEEEGEEEGGGEDESLLNPVAPHNSSETEPI